MLFLLFDMFLLSLPIFLNLELEGYFRLLLMIILLFLGYPGIGREGLLVKFGLSPKCIQVLVIVHDC